MSRKNGSTSSTPVLDRHLDKHLDEHLDKHFDRHLDKYYEDAPPAVETQGEVRSVYTWAHADARTWARRAKSPVGVVLVALVLVVALLSYGLGAGLRGGSTAAAGSGALGGAPSGQVTSGSASSDSTNATRSNVPNATQEYGGQPAQYTIDPDGAKHFTFTTQQVMWEPVKGKRVLAWTVNATVPGPAVRVTAGDHVRFTVINRFPEPTALHWHGLEVPASADGVPGVGMQAIEPGKSYTYDFTIKDSDAGTHWYHSHYDDLVQVNGGVYGSFIVDPRPGTPEAQKAVRADVEYTQFVSEMGGYFVLNGKSYPDTQPIKVKQGQTVRLRLIGAGNMIHPMHIHGHTFTQVAEDGRALPAPVQLDTIDVSPGKTYDLVFNAWAAPGSVYPFHCHILSHVLNPGQKSSEMGGLIAAITYER